MLNEPETYLHLSAPLTSYLQGLYRIRAEHLQSSRWASSLSSIVSANMADKGDTPTKTSLADGQPVSKRATRAAAATNLLGAFSAASDRQSAASQQQQATDSVSSSAATGAQLQPSSQSGAASASQFSSSGLQVINVDSHSLANQPLQRQQAVAAPVMFNAMSSAVQVHLFSSLPTTQAQSHHSHAHAHLTAGGRGQTYWHSETQLLAVIPEELKSFMYFGDNFTATQRATYDKHVARRMQSGDCVEDQSNPMFCHRITMTFSASDTSEVPTEAWSAALVRICSFDSPALYRITTVLDPGNEEAKDSLKKRREVIETIWRAMLNDAYHQVAITFDVVSSLLVALVQSIRAKEKRLTALLVGGGSAADEILAGTAKQVVTVSKFFDHLMPRLNYSALAHRPQDRAP